MKSKKKPTKPKFKKIKEKMSKITKSKPTRKQLKELKSALENTSERAQAYDKHAGSKFEDFMAKAAEKHGIVEGKILDREPIEFKDHQVNEGSQFIFWGEQPTPRSWYEKFLAIFGFKRKF